ncbi:MAG: endolytic transglycosylase MltG [Proteobacteria bacterium]|nr:endolytic transglycosylase MltG [Pseudomonadota bacterium]
MAAAILLFVVGSSWLTWQANEFLNTSPESPGREVVIDIPPGSSFDSVARTLLSKGLITDFKKFRMLGRWKEKLGAVKAGEFLLNTNWKPQQILDVITSGQAMLHKLFIPEGLTWWQIGHLVEDSGLASFESFEKAVHNKALLTKFNIPFDNAEGFLFPNTYLLPRPRAKDAEPIVRSMLSAFWRHVGDKLWPTGPPSPDQLARVVILASMVEKETGADVERERIAGVFANRIRKRMLLQCDPTVIYGLGTAFDGNLTRSHLKDKSNPYNSYALGGLPPGPICSPGLRSLESAATPEQHSLLYFVAKGDGTHQFSSSLKEHNLAVKKFQLHR